MVSVPPHGHPGAPYGSPMPADPRPNRTLRNVLIGVAVVLALCVLGTILIGVFTDDQPSNHYQRAVAEDATTAAPAPSATGELGVADPVPVPSSSSSSAAAPVKPAHLTFTDEDTPAHVGEDIPAGTYRVTVSVAGQDCYWMKSGDAEGARIIDNALPQGGRPQVTLKKGQWFTSERCGTWSKR